MDHTDLGVIIGWEHALRLPNRYAPLESKVVSAHSVSTVRDKTSTEPLAFFFSQNYTDE